MKVVLSMVALIAGFYMIKMIEQPIMKKFSLVFSWVLILGLLAGCSAPHTQSSMQKPVSATPALPLDSDIDNRQLVLDKFGQLKEPYKHCEIAH